MFMQAATCNIKEAVSMNTHEKAEMLKKKLVAMGITTEEELDKRIQESGIDISMFVPMPKEGKKSA